MDKSPYSGLVLIGNIFLALTGLGILALIGAVMSESTALTVVIGAVGSIAGCIFIAVYSKALATMGDDLRAIRKSMVDEEEDREVAESED